MLYEGYTASVLSSIMDKKTASVARLIQLQSSQVAGSGTGTEGIRQQSDEVCEIRRQCFK